MERILENYNSDNLELTKNEMAFMMTFLAMNGCGAGTVGDLLSDNFSCQTFGDLVDIFPEWSESTIKGILGSLVKKQVIMIEDERGFDHPSKDKLPDLYWATEYYLEQLNPELELY